MRWTDFWWRERPGLLSTLLAPVALFWRRSAVRRLAEPASARLLIPVVCVGNPTVGGAGKTPTAIALATIVAGLDKRPFFLTRGYRGKLEGPVQVDPAKHTGEDVGDEALLLARHHPTIVAADRAAGGDFAYRRGADVVIMDDGFQNPQLHKDLALLVVDGEVGIGNGRVVPAGPLRAPMAAQWPHAGVVVVVGDGAAGTRFAEDARAHELPVWQAYLVGRAPHLVGRKVVAFAGIGRPEKFFGTLEGIGADVVARRAFADHHPFTEREADALLALARQHDAQLVATEKDLARLTGAKGRCAALLEATMPVPARIVFDEAATVERYFGELLRRRHASSS